MAQTMLTITGRVSQPPKVCHSKTSGAPFGVVSVAVNNQRYDKEKEKWVDTDTTFYDLVCFGSLGANMVATLSVGDPVVAMGRFKVAAWEGAGYKSQTPTLNVEHIGPDLRFGHASYSKGHASYHLDQIDEEVDWSAVHGGSTPVEPAASVVPPQVGPADDPGEEPLDDDIPADEDGVVSDEDAEQHYARSA